MISQDLKSLEEKSIYVIREAKIKFPKIAALWSMGKDSTAMLALARKAFLGKVPFPVIHIDNGIDFPETYKFREELAKKWKLDLIVPKSEIKPELSGFACCGANKTVALKKVMKSYGFDALIVSIRRDEHGIRAKERYMSPRDKNFKWDYKDQPAELWDDYSSKLDTKGHIRVHPLLDWNEIDIWNFIKKEKVPMNPLYFARDGHRYRSLGCLHCTVPLKSKVKDINGIIRELETTKIEERSGREQDKEKAYVMQKLRALGYM
ncbi:MAG: sulfate adenylyltransferase subunit CysD [Candidatus Micrarchaeota archaeon]|nr:sulfate adenylyltransferase subunit CysD [Candidatus Micrarchaeota archaeon]MDE1864430.1 sulfate adenylyltransferase subunit CysD [Candidatus Micrarchaeota archaeon]